MWDKIAGALTAAGSIGGSFVEGIANLSKKRRQRINQESLDMAQQAADYNYMLDQQAADAAHQRQIDLFNRQANYNDPSAQAARLKAAGFNPALAYSTGGGGMGVSMPSAQGHQGGTMRAPESRQMPMSFTRGIDLVSMQTLKAQKDLINAEAALKRTQAENLKPTSEVGQANLENLKAQTADILESVENRKIQREGWQVQNELSKLELELAKDTKEINFQLAQYRLKDAMQSLDKMIVETSILKTDDTVKKETMKDAIKLVHQQVELNASELIIKSIQQYAMKMDIQLTDYQIGKLQEEVKHMWSRYYTDVDQTSMDNILKARGQEYTMWGTLNKMMDGIADWLDGSFGHSFEGKRWKKIYGDMIDFRDKN